MRNRPKRSTASGRNAFIQAHWERLEDARTLFQAARWGGAIYMGGYVVECLLKAVLLKRLNRRALPQEFRHHNLEQLTQQAGLSAILYTAPEAAENRRQMQLIHRMWDVTIRYAGKHYGREDAKNVLTAVERIRRCLLARI